MKKPTTRFETERLHARLDPRGVGSEWAGDRRAETFLLEGGAGLGPWRATLGLDHQTVEPALAEEQGLIEAVTCWLIARGQRRISLWTTTGERLSEGEISVSSLDHGKAAAGGGPSPRRLITLAPSNVDVVAALGASDHILACEDSSELPAGLNAERLGPDLAPDLDRVRDLEPDLVLSSLSVPGMERVVTGLRARGVPQVVLAPRSTNDVADDLTRVGDRLGLVREAEAARGRFLEERARLHARRREPPVRVYLEWWPRPMFSPGADCFSNELIALAGGTNVFAARRGSSVEISVDELTHADPDVCFLSWCGVDVDKIDVGHLERRPGLRELRAVREGRVFRLDERFAGRPGPSMLEASRKMAAAIDPWRGR